MDTTQSLAFIKSALELANQKGVYNLQDSATIFSALINLEKALSHKIGEPIPDQPTSNSEPL